MKFQGALIREQGVSFAIVIVKYSLLNDPAMAKDREEARNSFRRYFPGVPIILMAQDSRGQANYHGRKDIVDFLAEIPVYTIPWKEYTVG